MGIRSDEEDGLTMKEKEEVEEVSSTTTRKKVLR